MLLVDGADLRGDARYLSAKARATGDAELLRIASSLLTSARQCERDAWELAAREGQARPRQANPLLDAITAAGNSAPTESAK
jgi:hypothetical protein